MTSARQQKLSPSPTCHASRVTRHWPCVTWLLAVLMFAAQAGGVSAPAGDRDPTPASSLREAVLTYLTTEDAARADRLLGAIVNDPSATLERVREILRDGRSYAPRPVGILPSQPVRSRDRDYTFGLYVPPSYDPARAYPLVICLHGAGFTGDAYLERWQPRLGGDYLLACPTLVRGDWWTRSAEELVLATLHAVSTRYHVDRDRVFLTGMSNGGIGAWLVGCHRAPLFAGLMPMASGIDDVLFPFLENLRNTPVYIIHGRRDQVMPIELSRSIAMALAGMGYAVTFREHDRVHPIAGGHFFPREELPELVRWLDGRRRDPSRTTVTLVRDTSHLSRFGWVRIDATDEIATLTEDLVDSRDALIRNRVYARLHADVVGPNRLEVRTERVRRLTLFLHDGLVDVRKPVRVSINGRTVFDGPVHPSLATMLREARYRQDWSTHYTVELRLTVEKDASK